MDGSSTTLSVQRYLDQLNNLQRDVPAEPVVRELLGRAVERLEKLCAAMLYRSYPRLARGPLNLRSDEVLSAVVERLIKAMRTVRPQSVRQFFALVNQHMRWELNALARQLDEKEAAIELRESKAAPAGHGLASRSSSHFLASRILTAIDSLPDDEREVFNLVRIQGMSYAEAAAVIGVAAKTVQRRLGRCLALLSENLGDLVSPSVEMPVAQV